MNGIQEQFEDLSTRADENLSYNFVLEAQFIMLENLQYINTDMAQRMKEFPELIEQSMLSVKNVFAASVARINLSIAQYNWLRYNHNHPQRIKFIETHFTEDLVENPLSTFYNHYAQIFTDNFDELMKNFDIAISIIEKIADKNLLYKENSLVIQIALARELSANGFYAQSDLVFKKLKTDIDKEFEQLKPSFYINYITNLVKHKSYQEVIFSLDNEFSSDNNLYKNMLLQNRLLCYLYLKDISSLEKYITYDLDSAPFPQNYMLKIIKSVHFYLIKDFDTALNIVNSLVHSKNIVQIMKLYQPVTQIYKMTYQLAKK